MDFFRDFNCALNVTVDPYFGFILEKSQKFTLAYSSNIEIVHVTIAQGLNKRFAARRKRLHDIFLISAWTSPSSGSIKASSWWHFIKELALGGEEVEAIYEYEKNRRRRRT